ncbi:MAG: hypothetical protein GY856_03590 [bacterium]|nr:hypothetical protein [bacterium]
MTVVDAGIARLTKALDLRPQGQVFIVLVDPGFDGDLLPNATVLDGALLLGASSVSEALDGLEADALVEVRFATGPLPGRELRWLNQQREQLRREQSVVLRLPGEQASRFAKFARDVWRWATVLDLTTEEESKGLGKPSPAVARLEEDPYAPAMDPADAVEIPSHELTDPGLDDR